MHIAVMYCKLSTSFKYTLKYLLSIWCPVNWVLAALFVLKPFTQLWAIITGASSEIPVGPFVFVLIRCGLIHSLLCACTRFLWEGDINYQRFTIHLYFRRCSQPSSLNASFLWYFNSSSPFNKKYPLTDSPPSCTIPCILFSTLMASSCIDSVVGLGWLNTWCRSSGWETDRATRVPLPASRKPKWFLSHQRDRRSSQASSRRFTSELHKCWNHN